jgi:hypothetical protein
VIKRCGGDSQGFQDGVDGRLHDVVSVSK